MGTHPRVLVNDRVDIALALGAAGVHLRSHSILPSRLRTITPAGFLISVACHSAEDVMDAAQADFAVLAPIFSPLSKVDTRSPLGLAVLREICARSPVPVIALGGITEENSDACVAAGAVGVAGISLFLNAR